MIFPADDLHFKKIYFGDEVLSLAIPDDEYNELCKIMDGREINRFATFGCFQSHGKTDYKSEDLIYVTVNLSKILYML